MSVAMIHLVGEQPAPNLLPTRFLKPEVAVLVYTEFTSRAAENLRKLLTSQCDCRPCVVDAYNIPDIQAELGRFLAEELGGHKLVFNLTGGTKPMALAAHSLAQQHQAPILYLQTQGHDTLLYTYEISGDGSMQLVEQIKLPGTIAIDDYLTMYISDYECGEFASTKEGLFERAVYEALEPHVDEIVASVKKGGALEIDLVVRCGNRVGIVEVKTGKKARTKDGIDQLNTAGGRAFLGIYTSKFLVVNTTWDKSVSNLRELAEARNIQVIELPDSEQTYTISAQGKATLITRVQKVLQCN